MKAKIISSDGKKISEIEMPSEFNSEIREDVIAKVVEAEKIKQPYAPFYLAGKQASASGKVKHSRRLWKTAYGHGISRVPRKILSRHGTRFTWVGATISSAVKGREAHPPRIASMLNFRKINKKEYELALNSAISASASKEFVRKKYSTLDKDLEVPFVVDKKVLEMKTKEFVAWIGKLIPLNITLKDKEQRAGKGKRRGRRLKSSAGILIVIADKEKTRIGIVDIVKVSELSVTDLASGKPGRIVLWSEDAIKQLNEGKFAKKTVGVNAK